MMIRITPDIHRARLVTLASLMSTLFLGCGGTSSTQARPRASSAEIPIISAAELASVVEHSTRPVVVEFGVPIGCFRCNDMRPQYDQLAKSLAEEVGFYRVDFNAAGPIAAEYGATVCPSYVVFANGKPVACRRYPTSVDLVASDLKGLSRPKLSSQDIRKLQSDVPVPEYPVTN